MIIGNGLISNAFLQSDIDHKDHIIFGSGVSNSRETDKNQYQREWKMIQNYCGKGKTFVYFSTLSIFDPTKLSSDYVQFKKRVERHIVENCRSFIIVRLPILISNSKNPNTLFNFLTRHIIEGQTFELHRKAERFLVDIDDVVEALKPLLKKAEVQLTVNLAPANPIALPDLVSELEKILQKKAIYTLSENGASYSYENNYLINKINGTDYYRKILKKYTNRETMNKTIDIQFSDKGIATLTVNRPKALNAINEHVMNELHDFFFGGYKAYEGLVGVILTGSGEKAFIAGADITQFPELDVEAGQSMSLYGQKIFAMVEAFHVPVIAIVNGFSLGGGNELAMACHLRIATPNAKFGQPEVNLGLVPGYGGTQRLVQLIGKGRAMELLLTADMINAETALSYGLVNYVLNREAAFDKAREILEKTGSKGPKAIEETIRCIVAHFDETMDGYLYEAQAFGRTMGDPESKEGVQAFLEKRKADFRSVN